MKALDRHDEPNARSRGEALPKPPSPGCSWHGCQTRPRLLTALGLALLGVLLLGLVSTLPVLAAYQYRMVVTNATGAPLYLYVAPWDTLRGDDYYNPTQSSCLDMAGGLGVQRAIPIGGSTTLVFNRSGRCTSLQGWLSLRASANPQSTGTDYQQFWFDDDEGALEKHGRMSVYENQLAGSSGFYTLNVLTATDLGHDYFRYGYKMAVKNSSVKPIWVTAAPDDKGGYGHLRSSCITPNPTLPFGQSYQLRSGEIKNFYFSRSAACSGEQGYFSLRASAEPNSTGTDFEQFDFDADTGTLQKAADGVRATWPNTLARLGMGNYLLDVTGAETVGGYLFRNYGYQFPEYANWPRQNPVTRSLGNWDATRQYAELTWRTTGQNIDGQPISLPVGGYISCFGHRYWHTQSMVQLPSKGGHAYFARTDSSRRLGSFYVMKADADAYDPVNDYVKDTAGTDGAVVYLDQYWSGSPIGDWNHPGDMSVVGNLLIIAGQQWHSSKWLICKEFDDLRHNDYYEGQDADAVLFYDVSDPERPKYLGKITEGELGFGGQDAIDAVGLSKTANGIWSFMVGGHVSGENDGITKYFRAQKPWPNLTLWQPYTNSTGQIVTLNSYENQPGVERLLSAGLSRPCKIDDPVLDCVAYFDDFARLNTATVRFLEPAPNYNLTFNTTSAERKLPQDFFPELHKNCSEGGGSVAVSKSGAVNIHCPFLGEPQKPGNNACTDTSQNCIVSFHYSMPNPNLPPGALTSPTPADAATNLPITTIFSWGGGDDPDAGASVTYDVLLSIPSARNDLFRTICAGITAKTCDASSYLQHKNSYTWQVVANDGWQSTRGPLWTFTTISGNVPPNVPTTPDPVDTALNVPVTTYLSWQGSDPDAADTLTYDVYLARFGEATYTLVCNDLATAVCDLPSELAYGSGYFWMVETFDGEATTRGPDWRFNTPPGFTLSVDVNPKTFRTDGEVFEYTYTIQNTGDAALTEPFTVVDSRLGTLPSCGSTPLAVGASITCTANYTTVEGDVGDWIPTTAFAQYGALASAPADTYISYDDPAQLVLVVEAEPLVYRQVGDQITYTYTVVNVGEVSLTGPYQ